jgi:hypothetical protein
MAAAAHVLCKLACAPFEGEPIIKLTAPQYDRALTRLAQREEEVFQWSEVLPVDRDDVSVWGVHHGAHACAELTQLGRHHCMPFSHLYVYTCISCPFPPPFRHLWYCRWSCCCARCTVACLLVHHAPCCLVLTRGSCAARLIFTSHAGTGAVQPLWTTWCC